MAGKAARISTFSAMFSSLTALVAFLGILSYRAYHNEPINAVLGSTAKAKVTIEDVSIDTARGMTTVTVSILPQQNQSITFRFSDFSWSAGGVMFAPTQSFVSDPHDVVSGGGYTKKLYFMTAQTGTLIVNPAIYTL